MFGIDSFLDVIKEFVMKESEQVKRLPRVCDASEMTFHHIPQLSGNGCEDKEERRGIQDEARDKWEWSSQLAGFGVRPLKIQ